MCTDLRLGTTLSAQQIANRFGGNAQSFLPSSDRRITCCRFNPALNPEGPTIILVGHGPQRQHNAQLLVNVGNSIPVFRREGIGRFVFVGCFKGKSYTESSAEVKLKTRNVGNPDEVAGVLVLEPA